MPTNPLSSYYRYEGGKNAEERGKLNARGIDSLAQLADSIRPKLKGQKASPTSDAIESALRKGFLLDDAPLPKRIMIRKGGTRPVRELYQRAVKAVLRRPIPGDRSKVKKQALPLPQRTAN